jgi:transposase-like protein
MTPFSDTSVWKRMTVDDVAELSDDQCLALFQWLRWTSTQGRPVCPFCGSEHYQWLSTRARMKCADCDRQYSETTKTIFHSAKLPYRVYLALLAVMHRTDEPRTVRGIAERIGISYKSAYVLTRKIIDALLLDDAPAAIQAWRGYWQRRNDGPHIGQVVRSPKRCLPSLATLEYAALTRYVDSSYRHQHEYQAILAMLTAITMGGWNAVAIARFTGIPRRLCLQWGQRLRAAGLVGRWGILAYDGDDQPDDFAMDVQFWLNVRVALGTVRREADDARPGRYFPVCGQPVGKAFR